MQQDCSDVSERYSLEESGTSTSVFSTHMQINSFNNSNVTEGKPSLSCLAGSASFSFNIPLGTESEVLRFETTSEKNMESLDDTDAISLVDDIQKKRVAGSEMQILSYSSASSNLTSNSCPSLPANGAVSVLSSTSVNLKPADGLGTRSSWHSSPREFSSEEAKQAAANLRDTRQAIADRRVMFFSEPPKSPMMSIRSSSQQSVSISTQMPIINLVAERAKRFEKPSLDIVTNSSRNSSSPGVFPLYGCNSVAAQAAGFEQRSYSRLPSNQKSPSILQAQPPAEQAKEHVLSVQTPLPIIFQLESLPPPQCATFEPSPERVLSFQVSSMNCNYNNLHAPNANIGSTRLVSSTSQLDTLGMTSECSRLSSESGTSRQSMCLFSSLDYDIPCSDNEKDELPEKTVSLNESKLPSVTEILMKTGSKEHVQSSTSDSLPNTPSSGALSTPPKSGSMQKIKAFFAENTQMVTDGRGETRYVAECSSDISVEISTSSTTTDKKSPIVIFDVGDKFDKSSKGKKSTSKPTTGKLHGFHSPGSKPKKSPTDKDGNAHKESWKGKVARTIKRYGSGSILSTVDVPPPQEVSGVFGVPLDACEPSQNDQYVPLIVDVCTRIVEERGLENQGIYRVPGNTGAIKELQDEINKDPKGLCLDNEKWQDVNLVSSLLKLYFRKLPDSLITNDLYEYIIAANRLENSEKRMLKLKKLLHELPEHNFSTFQFLAKHLNRLASHEEANKMDAHNLAIMFGPTLIRPQDNTMVNLARNMSDQVRVVETIILHCDWFFGSWDEDVNVPIDEDSEDSMPISGLNEQMVAKAESLAAANSPSVPNSRHRDVVFSVIKAANRKLKPKDNKEKTKNNSTTQVDGSGVDHPRSSVGSTGDKHSEEETHDIDLNLVRYSAYHFNELTFIYTDSDKPKMRQSQSAESLLDSKISQRPPPMNRIVQGTSPKTLVLPYKPQKQESNLDEFESQESR